MPVLKVVGSDVLPFCSFWTKSFDSDQEIPADGLENLVDQISHQDGSAIHELGHARFGI